MTTKAMGFGQTNPRNLCNQLNYFKRATTKLSPEQALVFFETVPWTLSHYSLCVHAFTSSTWGRYVRATPALQLSSMPLALRWAVALHILYIIPIGKICHGMRSWLWIERRDPFRTACTCRCVSWTRDWHFYALWLVLVHTVRGWCWWWGGVGPYYYP